VLNGLVPLRDGTPRSGTVARMSDWIRHAVWWQVYPLGATGAECDRLPEGAPAVPRLSQLQAWLPHLVELGCNGLALGPVFESSTHGYDTVDHSSVDRRLGTEQDLTDLIEACHARGVRVLLDGVFNHVGRDFPHFREVLDEGPGSASASWFHIDAARGGPDGFGYRDFEGHSALVALDHANPEVAQHVAEVMTYWCDRGVDAWRLDAAYAVPPAFWRDVLPRVRERHPDVWVVGEVLHGDYAGYVAASGIDSVTQYELWKAVWSSLNDRNLFELAHALARHAEMVVTFLPQTFVGNHDVTRLASRLDDRRHLPLALALLFALPGVPTVYYGDEFGLRGVKEEREGGDDAVRPRLPESVAPPGPEAAAVAELHRLLIGVRRRHAWLAGAAIQEPDVLSNEVLAVRLTAGEEALAVVLNVADRAAEVRLPMPGAAVVAGQATVRDGSVQVPPHDFALLTAGG
jgi:cyclomaltodextrinase